MASPFYWDMSPEARAFSDRFAATKGMPPTMIQASVADDHEQLPAGLAWRRAETSGAERLFGPTGTVR